MGEIAAQVLTWGGSVLLGVVLAAQAALTALTLFRPPWPTRLIQTVGDITPPAYRLFEGWFASGGIGRLRWVSAPLEWRKPEHQFRAALLHEKGHHHLGHHRLALWLTVQTVIAAVAVWFFLGPGIAWGAWLAGEIVMVFARRRFEYAADEYAASLAGAAAVADYLAEAADQPSGLYHPKTRKRLERLESHNIQAPPG